MIVIDDMSDSLSHSNQQYYRGNPFSQRSHAGRDVDNSLMSYEGKPQTRHIIIDDFDGSQYDQYANASDYSNNFMPQSNKSILYQQSQPLDSMSKSSSIPDLRLNFRSGHNNNNNINDTGNHNYGDQSMQDFTDTSIIKDDASMSQFMGSNI